MIMSISKEEAEVVSWLAQALLARVVSKLKKGHLTPWSDLPQPWKR